jgi:hypothetical protein
LSVQSPAAARAFAAAILVMLAVAVPASAAPVTLVYSTKNADQTLTVPPGVTSIGVVLVGGKGGEGQDGYDLVNAPGGFGSRVTVDDLAVTPGQVLHLMVGGNGESTPGVDGCNWGYSGHGGFNGGGRGGFAGQYGGCGGGGGGGATDIRTDATLAGRIVVAAGGGGSGAEFGNGAQPGAGGDAGSAGGGLVCPSRGTLGGGGAGTESAGGAAGSSTADPADGSPGSAGSLGTGGAGGDAGNYAGGGGGGGGYYGGGGGGSAGFCAAGGGGGSDLVPSGGVRTLDSTGTPQIRVTLDAGAPAAMTTPSLTASAIDADGYSTSVATVRIADENGTPIPGQAVTFATSDPGVGVGATTDNGDGTYSSVLTASHQAGSVTVTATLGGLSKQATLTQDIAPATTITSPAQGASVIVQGDESTVVTGTASATVDAVDVVCRSRDGEGFDFTHLGDDAANVPVTGGTWSASVRLGWIGNPFCDLVAVPAGTHPTRYDTFPPRSLRMLQFGRYHAEDGPNEGMVVAYSATLVRPTSTVSVGLFGRCGVSDFERYASVVAASQSGAFRCSSDFPDYDWENGVGPVLVDGHTAFTAGLLLDMFDDSAPGMTGFPAVTASASLAPSGDFVIEESQPLVRCAGEMTSDNPRTTCGDLVPVGLRIDVRRILPADAGPVSEFVKIVSTDEASHTLDMRLARRLRYGINEWQLPGGDDFTSELEGFAAFADGLATMVSKPADDEDADRGFGVLSRAGTGSDVDFNETGFTEHFAPQVTPSAPFHQAYAYNPAWAAEDIAAAKAAAEAAITPLLSIATTAQSTEATSIEVTGTASDHGQLAGLTVGGETTTVAENGTWSRNVPLAVGANTVTVRATNVYGVVTERQVVITRTEAPKQDGGGGNGGGSGGQQTTPPPPPAPNPPAGDPEDGPLDIAGPPKAFSAGGTYVVAPGLTASCPEGGPACTAEITATMVGGARIAAKKRKPKPAVAGKAKLVVRPGAAKPLTFKLSKKAARALRKRGSIRLKVTVVLRSGGKVVDRTTRTIRVKAPRKKT